MSGEVTIFKENLHLLIGTLDDRIYTTAILSKAYHYTYLGTVHDGEVVEYVFDNFSGFSHF